MIARFIELTIKPEKKTEVLTKVREEVLPIMKKAMGFLDLIPLEIETEPTKFLFISFWHEKYQAEKYEKELFPKVKTILEPFLTMPVVVKYCKVDTVIREKAMVAA